MGKKVGLATCFLNNYGACLQAYALQEKIVQLGYDCTIIPYVEPDGYRQERGFLKLRQLKAKLQGNIVMYKNHKRAELFSRFKKNNLKLEKKCGRVAYYRTYQQLKDAPLRYDTYVCGSDQVWNPMFFGKNDPAYFLRFAQGKKKIAYAPSIGLSEMPDRYKEEFREYVSSFDAVSTREDAGTKIVKEVGNRDCMTVLDPTLLMGGEFWTTKVKRPKGFPYQKYILCSIFSDSQKISQYLKDVQKEYCLPIVYFPVGDLSYDGINGLCEVAGPLEFLWLIKNAEFVITDSFHGSAFSIMFHKKLFLISRKLNSESINISSRLSNLMNIAGIKNGYIDLDKPLEWGEETDYVEVEKNLQKHREKSEEFLRKALEDGDANR